ncbi:MAG: alpha/beta hydrolase [Peptostreptococcaceae bacterium]|nr:alpha/beta hydrolase [Peptostreptococcaceae bacterium]
MNIYTASDGCEIFYRTSGQGRPLIFIHGWSANSDFFSKQTEHFSKNFQVTVYDLRGHGRSDRRPEITEKNMTMERAAEDLYELIQHLKLENVNICGWSMGTSILLCYIKLFGTKNIHTISFIDMTPNLMNDKTWRLGDFDARGNLEMAQAIATDWDSVREEAVAELFARDIDKNSSDFIWVKEQMKNNTPHVLSAMWMAMALGDYREVLPQIDKPTFLAYGDGGDMYGIEHGEYMRDNIKKSQLVIFHHCGHSLFIEDPERFNREYQKFLHENSE